MNEIVNAAYVSSVNELCVVCVLYDQTVGEVLREIIHEY